MKPGWWLRIAAPGALVVLALAGAGVALWRDAHRQVTLASCPQLPHTCRIALDGNDVQLSFDGTPSALQPFTLRIVTPPAHAVHARFAMRDMDMGDIRYRLLSDDGRHWQSRVILPVCVSGRHDWVLTLEIDGVPVQIPFSA